MCQAILPNVRALKSSSATKLQRNGTILLGKHSCMNVRSKRRFRSLLNVGNNMF